MEQIKIFYEQYFYFLVPIFIISTIAIFYLSLSKSDIEQWHLYMIDLRSELGRFIWPSRAMIRSAFIIVLIFSLIMAGIFYLVDILTSKIVYQIFYLMGGYQ